MGTFNLFGSCSDASQCQKANCFFYLTKVTILYGTHSNELLFRIGIVYISADVVNGNEFWFLDLRVVPYLKSGAVQGATNDLFQENIGPIDSLFHRVK